MWPWLSLLKVIIALWVWLGGTDPSWFTYNGLFLYWKFLFTFHVILYIQLTLYLEYIPKELTINFIKNLTLNLNIIYILFLLWRKLKRNFSLNNWWVLLHEYDLKVQILHNCHIKDQFCIENSQNRFMIKVMCWKLLKGYLRPKLYSLTKS